MDKYRKEVARNTKEFKKILPELLEQRRHGQYALMRKGKLECVLSTFDDAWAMGSKIYKDEPFSIQPIVSEPINLGSYSHMKPCFGSK